MNHDMSDGFKSRDFKIAVTLQDMEYKGNIYYEYNSSDYGLTPSFMESILSSIIEYCENPDEEYLDNDISLKADINGKDIHFTLKNNNGDVLKKTIPSRLLPEYIVGYNIIKFAGHGAKKETRKCESCQNYHPISGTAKGNCSERGDVVARSRIICAHDYIAKDN